MINYIVRQISIDMITDTPNPIVEWFNDLWAKLNIIETNVYHQDGVVFIYYIMLDDKEKFIFLQDDNNDKFLGNYNNYWSILETKFNLKYTDIQDITKFMVETYLNKEIATPNGTNQNPIFHHSE